ncbi:MAG: hypothetical protein WBJ82_03335 [Tepidanaerobacteraceae bacterium]|nr:hypothetical protein [Tepidanaerobacteraceae bacterium]
MPSRATTRQKNLYPDMAKGTLFPKNLALSKKAAWRGRLCPQAA